MELEQIFFPVAFFFLFGATLAFFLSTWLYGKKINKTEAKKDKLIEELATLKERADQNRDQEEILKKISSEIWNSHEKTFTEKNKINLNALLSPMQINLKMYKDDLDKQIRNFEKNRTEFSAQFDMFHKINATMREETTKLTNALTKRSEVRGAWGESVLVKILEEAGMQAGTHFRVQESIITETGQRQRPDVVVCLPEGRSLVVDSKLSLLDWSDFVNSTNEIEKENAFARHIKAVRARVAELSSSRYQESFADMPDLVFMFVPLEDAFLEAVRKDKNLLLEAFSKKVYVMGPTSINLAINLVVDTWRQHRRVESFKSMLKRAELLSKKFEGFSEDMNNLGKHLKKAEDSFTRAEDKLFRARGNLDWQVKQLIDGGNLITEDNKENTHKE